MSCLSFQCLISQVIKMKPVSNKGRIKCVQLLKLAVSVLLVMALLDKLSLAEGKILPKGDDGELQENPRGNSDQLSVSKRNKLLRIRSSSQSRASMELTMRQFYDLVVDKPRYFNAFVLLYSDRDICEFCETSVKAMDTAARAYHASPYFQDESSRKRGVMFFIKVRNTGHKNAADFDPSLPHIFYFKYLLPGEREGIDQMNIEAMVENEGHFNLLQVLNWIQMISNLKFMVFKKEHQQTMSMSSILMITFAGGVGLCCISYFGYWEAITEGLRQINYSYTLTVAILWLLSGQMFNYMRRTPMFGSSKMELTSVIYPGSRYQYGSECIIVMLIYGLIIYSIIRLVTAREQQLSPEDSTAVVGTTENSGDPRQGTENSILEGLAGLVFGYVLLSLITQIKT